jgi:FkbM family methyltransferase
MSAEDKMAGGFLRQIIRERRRDAPVRLLARASEKFLRAYYNEDFYRFDDNGEAFALSTFARWCDGRPVIWDVGANSGQWAAHTHQLIPGSTIHSFEILPPIAEAWQARLGKTAGVTLHPLGLSDKAGTTEVTWNRDCDVASSITIRRHGGPGGDFMSMVCTVSTVDAMIADGLPPPALLKIDTEGHDAAVLRGARGLLESARAPAMIQFEYGSTWLPAGETLEQVQEMLEGYGYRVGRLYPTQVGFKRYEYHDDQFRMGNMIAARPPELVAALAG